MAATSVLSYVYKRSTLTPLDIHLIHTLYDPRMTIGLKPAAGFATGLSHPRRTHGIERGGHRGDLHRPQGARAVALAQRLE